MAATSVDGRGRQFGVGQLERGDRLPELPRRMRRMTERLQTPNSEREPIRYQWYTRPYADGLEAPAPPQSLQRMDSNDILEAVRSRIRSPPDQQIRNKMQQMPAGEQEVNSVLAHYLAGSSLADSVLNYRLTQQQQQQPGGCSCCAGVNLVNKNRRHLAARGTVPLTEHLQHNSSLYYGQAPDSERVSFDDHRRLRRRNEEEPLQRTEQEEQLQANLRRLQRTIEALDEPPEQVPEPTSCQVGQELAASADYYRPGVLPTKYLAFAPKNPLRHAPPPTPPTADGRRRAAARATGRHKYVSFSPRRPQLKYYTPEASFT